MQKIIAYSYTRFSSSAQEKGLSKQRQNSKAAELCKAKGWHLDKSLKIDDHGRSAFKGSKQRGLQGFLSAIQSGRVQADEILIIERLDRLSRKDIDTARELCRQILLAGVKIATYSPERLYDRASLNDPFALLEMILAFKLANEESEKKSERTYYNWEDARKNARQKLTPMTTRRPAWLDLASDGKTFVLNKEKAKVIRRIFSMAIDGMGERTITNTLNREGIQNLAYGTKVDSRKHWNQGYVKLLLESETVFGRYQPTKFDADGNRHNEGDPIEGYYPAAIDEATYWAARTARQPRWRKPGRPPKDTVSLFSGILYDARTKTTMRLCNSSQIDKKHGCFRRITSWHCGAKASWRYEDFERAFFHFVHELNPDSLIQKQPKKNGVASIEAKLSTIEERLAILSESMQGEERPAIFKTLVDQIKRLEDQRETTVTELKIARQHESGTSAHSLRNLRSFAETLANVKESEREAMRYKARNAVRSLVKEVWLQIDTYKLWRVVKVGQVQVFFHDGSSRTYKLLRYGTKDFYIGLRYVKKEKQIDLRESDGKPIKTAEEIQSMEATLKKLTYSRALQLCELADHYGGWKHLKAAVDEAESLPDDSIA